MKGKMKNNKTCIEQQRNARRQLILLSKHWSLIGCAIFPNRVNAETNHECNHVRVNSNHFIAQFFCKHF